MSARDTIFRGIREALAAGTKPRTPRPAYDDAFTEPQWLAAEKDERALFARRFALSGGRYFASPETCATWLAAQKITRLYLAPELAELAPVFAGHFEITHDYDRAQVDQIEAAITMATGAIAESGTIILTDSDSRDRLAALAPWHHIAAIPAGKLQRTIPDAVTHFPKDPNTIWVSGPSKTADVEGILIQGVHGPGEQGCFFV